MNRIYVFTFAIMELFCQMKQNVDSGRTEWVKDGYLCLGLRVGLGCWCVPKGHLPSLHFSLPLPWKQLQATI